MFEGARIASNPLRLHLKIGELIKAQEQFVPRVSPLPSKRKEGKKIILLGFSRRGR